MSILLDLKEGPVGQIMTTNGNLVGVAFQFIHILGLIAVLTAVLLVALRLVGAGLKQRPLPDVVALAKPFLGWGLLGVVLSGVVMFASNAVVYAAHPALQIKLLLLLLALLVQFTVVRYSVQRAGAKVWTYSAASLSLLLWLGTGLAGRAIGFT